MYLAHGRSVHVYGVSDPLRPGTAESWRADNAWRLAIGDGGLFTAGSRLTLLETGWPRRGEPRGEVVGFQATGLAAQDDVAVVAEFVLGATVVRSRPILPSYRALASTLAQALFSGGGSSVSWQGND
jgi:hypothetical protein